MSSSSYRSPKFYARTAGVLYLINIVLGFFAIGYVPSVIINRDIHITAQQLAANEQLFRLGIAAHAIILMTNIPLGVIFYHLFRSVNRNVALAMVIATLIGTSVEASALLNQFTALLILKGAYMSSFSQEQLHGWIYMLQQLNGAGYNIPVFFFGFYGMSMGYLIYRSAFFPKIIGAAMCLGGACYMFNSIAYFLAPKFAASLVPYIQAPSGLAELGFCLYLLISGIRVDKWWVMQG